MAVKKASLWIMIAFYFFAGVNHFVNPTFYYGLIPPYLGNMQVINTLSGMAEILLAIGLMLTATRKIASVGIVLMLLAFIPAHIYFIQIGSCVEGGLCVSPLIGWLRLVVIHPLLIGWAWWHLR